MAMEIGGTPLGPLAGSVPANNAQASTEAGKMPAGTRAQKPGITGAGDQFEKKADNLALFAGGASPAVTVGVTGLDPIRSSSTLSQEEGPRTGGERQHGPVEVLKEFDASSPLPFQPLASNKVAEDKYTHLDSEVVEAARRQTQR